jgi:uncharacterized iron-regulated membrane protein
MIIALLVSLAGLLLAAAGLARHIWRQRARLRSNPSAGPASVPVSTVVLDPIDESDQEIEL